LRWWREESGWGNDILNSEYYGMFEVRSGGLTQKWWNATVDRLWNWKAIRSPNPPNTKSEIKASGLSRLPQLIIAYNDLLSRCTSEPNITELTWEDLSSIFDLASQLKRGPVFPSKMCHFIFPKVFIPMDNSATCVFEYEFYWRGMSDEWRRFDRKEEAIEILKKTIESDRPLHPSYPFETKVLELCHIGYQHRCAPAIQRRTASEDESKAVCL
jgi:hypothetical protein